MQSFGSKFVRFEQRECLSTNTAMIDTLVGVLVASHHAIADTAASAVSRQLRSGDV